MVTSRLICIVLALIVLAAPVRAQTIPLLRPGDWVRVQPQVGERASGTLMAIVDGQIRIQTSDNLPMGFALSDIARLELSVGRDRARGAKVGAVIGGVGGFVGAYVMSALGIPRGTGASLAVIGVPLVTTPAGAVLGALIGPHRYIDVSVLGR